MFSTAEETCLLCGRALVNISQNEVVKEIDRRSQEFEDYLRNKKKERF